VDGCGNHHVEKVDREGSAGDISRLPTVIVKDAPERRDSLIDGVCADADRGPDVREQIVDADDFARAPGEVHQ
jgi:hypothetical protein